MAAMRHEYAFPPNWPNAGYAIGKETIAWARGNGRVAPIADLHSTRAWGMPLDYRLSYASLPEAG